MTKISTFSVRNTDVDMTYHNGFLAYTFEVDGRSFGYKVKLEKKGIIEVASAAFLLFQNAHETMDALDQMKPEDFNSAKPIKTDEQQGV